MTLRPQSWAVVDDRVELVGHQLRRVDRLVLAGDAAGDHHLDQVGAERDLPAGTAAELGGAVAFERVAVAVAVAAGAHQRLAGGEDPRAGRPPGIDRRAQREVGTVAARPRSAPS